MTTRSGKHYAGSDSARMLNRGRSESAINERAAQGDNEAHDSVRAEDSVSQAGLSSASSSVVFNRRLLLSARRAALEAEAASVAEQHALDLEEFHLRQRRSALKIRTQLAVIAAEDDILSKAEESHELLHHEPASVGPVVNENLGAKLVIGEGLNVSHRHDTVADADVVFSQPASPVEPEWSAKVDNNELFKVIGETQQQNRQLIDAVRLPTAQLISFDGNPLRYWSFIRSFESAVDNCNVDDSAKLTRLIHYCTGKARKVVECCAVMDPSVGYARAKGLLKDRFGDNFMIAEAWINKITENKMIKAADRLQLQEFADDLMCCRETLTAMGYVAEINSQATLLKLVERLPVYLQARWKRLVREIRSSKGRNPTIDDVVRFIMEAAEEANDPVYGKLAESGARRVEPERTHNQMRARGASLATAAESQSRDVAGQRIDKSCVMCGESHPLFTCDRFKSSPLDERQKLVRLHKLCFNCLRAGHRSNVCKLNRVCTVTGCGKKHTRLLHRSPASESRSENRDVEQVANQNGFVEAGCNLTGAGCKRVVLPILPVVVQAPGSDKAIQTFALLDSGSTSSFCSKQLVDSLGLTGRNEMLSLTTLEAKNKITRTEVVSLLVSDLHRENVIEIPQTYVRQKLPLNVENVATLVDIEVWPHLSHVMSHYLYDIPDIGLLIGQDVPEALIPREVVSGACAGSPYAVRTALGWTVSGPVGRITEGNKATVSFVQSEVALERQVEMFWKLEEVSGKFDKGLSAEDRQALKIWDDSMQFVDGHYCFDIPFKRNPPCLPNNLPLAQQRLEGLKRRLRRDESLLKAYTNNMEELIVKGYAERIPANDIVAPNGCVWYLPHHPVFNPHKPEKIRIVFDCAAAYQGKSLNSCVLQGPDLCNKLMGVLLRFRQYPVAVMADVEAMFHQVKVSTDHQNYLRYLWWPDGKLTEDIMHYRMKVHLFGGAWSPSCCNLALKRTAEDNRSKYSDEVIRTVERNFYVDDCLRSIKDEAEAISLIAQLRELLATGGFKLTKWISNSRRVLMTVPEDDRVKDVRGKNLLLDELPAERALGMQWMIDADVLGYRIAPQNKPLTRRGVLSVISSLYDPLGFVGPFILPAKKLIQELCRKKIGWDDSLPESELSSWKRWLKDLPKIERFVVNRCFVPSAINDVQSCQLHHFSDASQDGYGVVSYIRLTDASAQISCSFVISKSRVAPLRQITIPRLELSAALLAVRVDKMLRRELDFELLDSVFWSDSMVALQYIRSETKRFHTFVENRVSEIRDNSVPSQWRYVNTAVNPADVISRGLTAEELLANKTWLTGPDFLLKDVSEWPSENSRVGDVSDSDPEVRKPISVYSAISASETQSAIVIEKLFKWHSSWYQLKRTVGWLLIVFDWLKCRCSGTPKRNMLSNITVDEINRGELCILKYVQERVFAAELKVLNSAAEIGNGKWSSAIRKSSSVHRLDPQLSEEGLLVVGGRLKCHQIILPQKHVVTDLIINHYHVKSGHSGKEHVLALIRERYWIVGARSVVRSVLKNCRECRRRNPIAIQQRMANLPGDRVTPGEPPFTYVGVDIFGPFVVKHGRTEFKRYGCLFTCLLIRAVHIEVVHSLETDSFLQALQRFICRRGSVRVIRSDNGTNFVGAARELRDAFKGLNQKRIADYLSQRSVQWTFNPPSASHMGGVWERQIRTVRKLLNMLLKEQTVNDEGLTTLMCLIESIINSRPLTTVSDDHRDAEPLTPNHLLLLRPAAGMPPGEFERQDIYSRKRWRQVQYLADIFWRRWTKEYLPTLQLRQKWLEPKRNIQIGDVVILMDDSVPRNVWPLGRITETFPGADGLVRSVVVRTKSGVFTRPVHKLCLLEPVHCDK